jgi:hypothetical protein
MVGLGMEMCAELFASDLASVERTEPAALLVVWRRLEASGSPIRRSRRLHYLSTNRDDFGGFVRTVADWISGGKRRCDNDL